MTARTPADYLVALARDYPDGFAETDIVRCDVCDEIVYVWPKRILRACFKAAADRLRAHLEGQHGLSLQSPAARVEQHR